MPSTRWGNVRPTVTITPEQQIRAEQDREIVTDSLFLAQLLEKLKSDKSATAFAALMLEVRKGHFPGRYDKPIHFPILRQILSYIDVNTGLTLGHLVAASHKISPELLEYIKRR